MAVRARQINLLLVLKTFLVGLGNGEGFLVLLVVQTDNSSRGGPRQASLTPHLLNLHHNVHKGIQGQWHFFDQWWVIL